MTKTSRRRALLAIAVSLGGGTAGGHAIDPALARLLEEGEGLLAQGEALRAYDVFQRAASMDHAPEIEWSIVRAQAQAGQFRQALSFAAHAALAHREFSGGLALYALMLDRCGQRQAAVRLLNEALATTPGEPALLDVRSRLDHPRTTRPDPLLSPPLRAAPYGYGPARLPSGTRVLCSAMLVDGGRQALLPLVALGVRERVWLRNGLGATVEGRVAEVHAGFELAQVSLLTPLPMRSNVRVSQRAPFAGSPGFTVEYSPARDANPAWPQLYQGFLGRTVDDNRQRLGLEMPPGPRGGPAFDRFGHLAGIVVPAVRGEDHWIHATSLQALVPLASRADAAGPTAAAEAVYEEALFVALQAMASDA